MNTKKIVKITILFIAGLMPFLALFIAETKADTYNFYFQKDAAPKKVVMGGEKGSQDKDDEKETAEGLRPSEQTFDDNYEPANKTLEPKSEVREIIRDEIKKAMKDDGIPNWRVSIGKAIVKPSGEDRAYYGLDTPKLEGTALTIGYNFNPYFGIELQGANVKADFGGDEWAGSLGMKITPVSINSFGHSFIEVSILAGWMQTLKDNYFDYNDWGYGDYEEQYYTQHDTAYAGLAVAVNFARNFGLSVEHRGMTEDMENGHTTANAVFKF